MLRWLAVNNRNVIMALALLAGVATTSLRAQQPAGARVPNTVTAPVGPRLTAPMPSFVPNLPRAATTPAYMRAADLNDQHTVVISTLGIILAAVIVILLLA